MDLSSCHLLGSVGGRCEAGSLGWDTVEAVGWSAEDGCGCARRKREMMLLLDNCKEAAGTDWETRLKVPGTNEIKRSACKHWVMQKRLVELNISSNIFGSQLRTYLKQQSQMAFLHVGAYISLSLRTENWKWDREVTGKPMRLFVWECWDQLMSFYDVASRQLFHKDFFYFRAKLNAHYRCKHIYWNSLTRECMRAQRVHSLANLTRSGLLYTFLYSVSFHSITSIICSPNQFPYAHD